MAEISPTRVVYPDNWQVKFILNLLLLACCFWGGPWRGSVGVVRGPVRIVVRGPGPYGGPWTGGQCFQVTRIKRHYLLTVHDTACLHNLESRLLHNISS